jgi:hypothetical protein
MIARVIIWALRRRRWHDPREARPEGSQFRDQKSRGFVEKLSRAMPWGIKRSWARHVYSKRLSSLRPSSGGAT